MEAQTFVPHTGTVISARGVEVNEVEGSGVMSVPGGGSSIVYGPDGTALTDDLPATEEGLIYCDLKMDDCIVAKGMIDSIGNYSRPDILSLTVNTETMEQIFCQRQNQIASEFFSCDQSDETSEWASLPKFWDWRDVVSIYPQAQ
jgi:hypothetical protein